MLRRRDAIRLLGQLALGLIGCGCFGTLHRHQDSLPAGYTAIPSRGQDIQLTRASAQAPPAVQSPNPIHVEPSRTSSELGPSNDAAKLRSIHQEAVQRYAAIDSYIVRLRRREQINGRDRPEEILLVRFRKQPWSIYFKWLGRERQGREVVYVKGQHEDKIVTLLAAGDMPLMPAGKRIALAPDNALVRASSRHSIHEAGIGVLIESLGLLLDATQKGDNRAGTLKYLGLLKRPELENSCEAIEQIIPTDNEPQLPRGGRRLWMFDPTTKLPVLLITHDETGHEVEYYCYDRFQYPVKLDDDDFDPDKLWKQKR